MQFRSDQPIYVQLVEHFKNKILRSEWKQTDKVPSVRDLALEYGVNPNTIQRALSELEIAGFVRSERTAGRFVSAEDHIIGRLKQSETEQTVAEFIEKMKSYGVTKDQTLEAITSQWEEK